MKCRADGRHWHIYVCIWRLTGPGQLPYTCRAHDPLYTRRMCPAKLNSGWWTGLGALHCLLSISRSRPFTMTLSSLQDGVELRPTSWCYRTLCGATKSQGTPHLLSSEFGHPDVPRPTPRPPDGEVRGARQLLLVHTRPRSQAALLTATQYIYAQPLRHASTQPRLPSSTPVGSWLRF